MPDGKFQGSAFGPWEPGKSVPVTVANEMDGFALTLDDGRRWVLPHGSVKLSRGGFDELAIVIEGPADSGEQFHVQLRDEAFLRELANGPGTMRAAARSLISAGQHTSRLWTLSSVVLIGFIVGSIAFVLFGAGYVAERAVAYIPPQLESELGELTTAALLKGRTTVTSGPVFDAINTVWQRVEKGISKSPFPFRLYVCDSAVVNAVAAPGGHVIVFTGLLTKCEAPEELAGILAHECEHAIRRHGVQNLLKSASLSIVLSLLLGDTGGLGQLFRQFGGELLNLSYSREAEREADRGAVAILVAAQIDPRVFPAFFERLGSGAAALEKTLSVVSTHPSNAERSAYLAELFRALPANQSYQPIAVDWAAVKRELKASPPRPD